MAIARTLGHAVAAAVLVAALTARSGAQAAAVPAVPATAAAGLVTDGMIIRAENGIVYIDLGADKGVMPGDLFDIVTPEVLAHPLTGDTLAVTAKAVGAVQVRQILTARMSIGRIVYLDPGVDPMLKPLARAREEARLEEIQQKMQRGMFAGGGPQVPLQLALVPGMYQLRTEQKRKGWLIAGVEAGALVAGFAYRSSSNDWYDQYQNLPAGLPQSEYDRFYNGAADRRTSSNRFFWLAGATYLFSWVDAVWMGGGAPSLPPNREARLQAGMKLSADGQPLLQLVRSF
ncbi:MAG: hypothetical protein ABIL09_27580 [Gemmatimonadota bacterium]